MSAADVATWTAATAAIVSAAAAVPAAYFTYLSAKLSGDTAKIAQESVAIAQEAAKSWRRNLSQQRKDECIGALFTCQNAVEGVLEKVFSVEKPTLGPFIDHAWASWRSYKVSHEVAANYVKLTYNSLSEGEAVLDHLSRFCQSKDKTPVESMDIRSRMSRFVLETERILRS